MRIRSKRNPWVMLDGVEVAGGGYLSKLDHDYRTFYPNTLWEEVKEERWEPLITPIKSDKTFLVPSATMGFPAEHHTPTDVRVLYVDPFNPIAGIRFERRVS